MLTCVRTSFTFVCGVNRLAGRRRALFSGSSDVGVCVCASEIVIVTTNGAIAPVFAYAMRLQSICAADDRRR